MSAEFSQSQPFQHCPVAVLAQVQGVYTDIDDTLTRDGAIEGAALAALHALAQAGIPVVAITGRPLGWSLPFARSWPVQAIVAESGAVALIRQGNEVLTEYAQDEPTRQANALRLQAVAASILRAVPAARLAQDSPGRATDIAIDHSEFATLSASDMARVVALMQQAGMTATVSSIHINGWFGSHDKLSAARWMAARLFGVQLDSVLARWLFVGDSTNDQPMFKALPLTVGVANLLRFRDQLQHWPAYITQAERGAGFAEVASAVLVAGARPTVNAGAGSR